ncbi:MAG: pyrroline-5-carboxylate reductase [Pirellulaceae bacterium]|nr:pyrroline-5-carboxylate reductase [Pirellulaceae bacterium]
MLAQRIGFVGAGQMARALARGMASAGLVRGEQLVAFDPLPAALAAWQQHVPGAQVVVNHEEGIRRADVVFLSVKPQSVAAVAQAVGNHLADEQRLLVSIVAGLPLAELTSRFGTRRVVRVMPNTPCLVGAGASGYACGPGATPEDGRLVGQMLEAVGLAVAVDESLLDAVTGLSGSGPAFVYVAIEALSDGGVRMGLPRDVATRLAAQTVLGAARMVLDGPEHPAVLKDRVASPGGTTIAGLQALEEGGLRAALIAAVQRAAERSRELGQTPLR